MVRFNPHLFGGFFVVKFYYICKMNYTKIMFAILLMILGQIGTFLQLQGGIKYGWYEKFFWLILLSGIPLTYLYSKSVNLFVEGFGGQIWPSRLIGFALGIIIFTVMSTVLFKEHMTIKTVVCIFLALLIVSVQLIWK